MLLGLTSLVTSRSAAIKSCSGIRIATRSPRTRPTIFWPPPGSELPHVVMAEYKLAQRARADLIDIYDFTEGRFGAYQAEAYHAGLVRSFGLLPIFHLSGNRSTKWRPVIDDSAFNRT